MALDAPRTTHHSQKKLVAQLLDWFAANARDLPWRRTQDPYAIWVSEIMLQQTQVKTVIPYWERWMRELPTIAALAEASPDKIHKLWEGLGYYTRVRHMQKAAQQIVAAQSDVAADVSPLHMRAGRSQSRLTSAATIRESKPLLSRPAPTLSSSDGERDRAWRKSRKQKAESSNQSEPPDVGGYKFPDTFDAVLALPGIGRYTAGAICSIAFNQPTSILDGNVIRVLTRVYGIATDPREKQTNAQLWRLAEELVTHAKPQAEGRDSARRGPDAAAQHPYQNNSCSHLNQSLMELGALICTPRTPNCAVCPVQHICVARKENLQEQLPNLSKREAATKRRFVAFVVEQHGKFLVRQRPAGVVNAHLWEFPNVEVGARVCDPQQIATYEEAPSNGSANSNKAVRLTEPRSAAKELSLKLTSTRPLVVIKHSITRYRITLEAWRAELVMNPPAREDARPTESIVKRKARPALRGEWRTRAELHTLAFTSAHKKILTALETRA
jgi:adenine-specific DNA glycosylase